MHDRERERDRDRGVGRVAAALHDAETDLRRLLRHRRQRRLRSDDLRSCECCLRDEEERERETLHLRPRRGARLRS
jgi:hypothetical protein